MAEPPSSPPSAEATAEDQLSWYKAQYEQLELELADFQQSSKELEAELEKDLDAADKRERGLQEKAEALEYEVEEWKTKYREAKTEANAAQNTLEKEVTSLRDSNRTLQLKLRDIEVANDDYARQARNTTSSLDDLESKYNVAIERAVLLEEEIKIGEQERETLRIDCQRLKDELSDLKIETEILQGKIQKQEARHLSSISTDISVPESPTFDRSPSSTASSPLITTPPDSKSVATADTISELQDPPSPPMSEASATLPRKPTAPFRTPAPSAQKKSRLPSADNSITPKPRQLFGSSTSRPPGSRVATTSHTRTPAPRPTATSTKRAASHKIPSSTSLSHIRSLTAQMQRLEARVQSVRSKLPAPVTTPPRASPRMAGVPVPSTVTIRSRKRTIGSATSSVAGTEDATPTAGRSSIGGGTTNFSSSTSSNRNHVPRLSTSGVSRLSFGPLPNRNPVDPDASRPSSRASVSYRPGSRTEVHGASSRDMPPPRPMSRTSMGGTRTPLGVRPRSSMSGSVSNYGEGEDEFDPALRTPSRRGTYSKFDADGSTSGIPMPSSTRRQSGGIPGPSAGGRRSSAATTVLEDLGETY